MVASTGVQIKEDKGRKLTSREIMFARKVFDTDLGRIDIQRSQIMAAARCTKPAKWMVRRS